MANYNDGRLGFDPDDRFKFKEQDIVRFGNGQIAKFGELMTLIGRWRDRLGSSFSLEPTKTWFAIAGFSFEILPRDGGKWRRGKFRFRLEFIPDDPNDFPEPLPPAPSLDDLRSQLKDKTLDKSRSPLKDE